MFVLLTNKTNKTMKVFMHGVLTKLERDSDEVTEENLILKSPDVGKHVYPEDLDIPEDFRGDVGRLIMRSY